jgi:hypothetical protein
MLVAHPRRSLSLCAGIAIAAVLVSAPSFARTSGLARSQASADRGGTPCFLRREWHGRWKTAPDARTIYIAVSDRIYRVDLESAYPLLKSSWAVLSDRDASDAICTALDFNLVVSNQIGVVEAVIAKRLTLLTPAEAAALPRNLRP